MRELHKGICGLFTGIRSLATKVVCAGYYWPTLRADALDIADIPCTPPNNLHSLSSHWPFAIRGIDILRPLPKAPGAIKYLLVAIDYFTNWMRQDHSGKS